MFTGIIEDIGIIRFITSNNKFVKLSVQTPSNILDDLKIGDSIAVNGICLTASSIENDSFSADVSPETLKKTTLGTFSAGAKVNLERAATPSTRLGGHIVSGHIDGVGRVVKKIQKGEGILFTIRADESILKYLVVNGSVCVDGISLTVVGVEGNQFTLMVIPYTLSQTTLLIKRTGDQVNIEGDMIGKYVEKFIQGKLSQKKDKITIRFLAENGFV